MPAIASSRMRSSWSVISASDQKSLHVLHPLEVAEDRSAGGGDDVGDDGDAAVRQEEVGGRRRAAIRDLGDDRGADRSRVRIGHLALEAGEDEDVAVDAEDVGLVGSLGFGEALDRVVLAHPLDAALDRDSRAG